MLQLRPRYMKREGALPLYCRREVLAVLRYQLLYPKCEDFHRSCKTGTNCQSSHITRDLNQIEWGNEGISQQRRNIYTVYIISRYFSLSRILWTHYYSSKALISRPLIFSTPSKIQASINLSY
jgi:hypothetical protein